MTDRSAFLAWLRERLGAPYIWAGKGLQLLGPDGTLKVHDFRGRTGALLEVYDCSGLVTCGIHVTGGPDWRVSHWTQRLWDELRQPLVPNAGDLCLYGSSPLHVDHVTVFLEDGHVLGACGGDHSTLDLKTAERRGAKVSIRSSPRYRVDFLGYRALP